MDTLDQIKSRLIDQILLTRNQRLLSAIEELLKSTQDQEKIDLKSEQIEMLLMSEKDIEKGNVISEAELNKSDSEWLS